MEEDDAFWGHDTWGDEDDASGNESFHDSDEDSAAKKDAFDSDFDDSESDHDEEEKAAGRDEEQEVQRQEKQRNNQQRQGNYVDAAAAKGVGGKKRGRGMVKRLKGDGDNAGIVLNSPLLPTSSTSSSATAIPTPLLASQQPLQPALPTTAQSSSSSSMPPPNKFARKANDVAVKTTLASTRERRSQNIMKRLRETRSTERSEVGKKSKSSSAATTTTSSKKSKRRQYAQEELLIEAVHDTEPENQRWILGRKRGQDLADKDKDSMSSLREKKGKVIQKYHSRRGCLITLTFPEMDAVPDILTRQQPKLQEASSSSSSEPTLCAITGKPARYRDPQTKLGYSDIAAFKELRRRHQAGEPLDDHRLVVKQPPKAPLSRKPTEANSEVAARGAAKGSAGAATSGPPNLDPKASNGQAIGTVAGVAPRMDANTPQANLQPQPHQFSSCLSPGNNIANGMESPPLSPSGRRLSRRKWNPSVKMLENIVNADNAKLAPGLQLRPSLTSSLVSAMGMEATTDVVASAPESTATTDTAESSQGGGTEAKETAPKQKPAAKGSNDAKPAAKKATATEKGAMANGATKNSRKRSVPSKKATTSKASNNEGTPKSSTDSNDAAYEASLQSNKAKIYAIPQDDESGDKKLQYMTQSELIMEAINNYSRLKEEEHKTIPNRK
jgi:hypothetical protein